MPNRWHRESDKWAWLITTFKQIDWCPNLYAIARVTTLSNARLGVATLSLVGRPHSRSLTSCHKAHTLKPLQGLADRVPTLHNRSPNSNPGLTQSAHG